MHAVLGRGIEVAQWLEVREFGPQHAPVLLGILRTSLQIEPERVTLRLNVYTNNGLSIREIEDFWLTALELPRSCLRKHSLNHYPTSSSGKKKRKLPYGVCTLCLYDTRVVQHVYGAIQEYGGFDEPRWLD
jgi:hypothetical protein